MRRKTVILFFFITIIFSLTGCQKNKGIESKPSPSGQSSSLSDSVIPLTVDQQTFQFIIGWLNEREILVYEWLEQEAQLYSYDMTTGERKEFLVLNEPIITARLSPSRDYLLIHSSPIPHEAHLQVFQTTIKEEIASVTVPSSEIAYEWNPFSEENILVTAFYEDWTYTTYVFDFSSKKLTEVNLPQPFATWLDHTDFLILNWSWDEPVLSAPLVKITPDGEEVLFGGEEFIHFQGKNDLFLGIQSEKQDLTGGDLFVYNHDLEELFSFSLPLLTNFSGWEIPFYDLLPGEELLIIEPYTGGEFDLYDEGFLLAKRNGSIEEVILDDVNNGPIACSPDGTWCLTGHQFEKIIYIEERKIEPFLIFRKGK